MLINTERLQSTSFEQYVCTAQNRLAAGSVGGAKVEYDGAKDDSPLQQGSLDKRQLMEHLEPETVMQWLDSNPELIGKGFEKFENGKGRAIISRMVKDYLICGFVLDNVDRYLGHVQWLETGHDGYAAIRDGLRQQAARMR